MAKISRVLDFKRYLIVYLTHLRSQLSRPKRVATLSKPFAAMVVERFQVLVRALIRGSRLIFLPSRGMIPWLANASRNKKKHQKKRHRFVSNFRQLVV